MFSLKKSSKKEPLIAIYDSSFLKAAAYDEIILYRVKLLKGINYVRLIFAGILLWYFYSVLAGELANNQLQIFWVALSAYVLLILFCNTALMYRRSWRWIFIVMALLEAGILSTLLTLVFQHELININMLLILCSLLLSVLTLTYIESIVFALFLGISLFSYLIKSLVKSQSAALFPNNTQEQSDIGFLWQALKENQFELVNFFIYTACLMLIIVMVGFLASQARDNKIYSHLTHLYNKQLRELNDSIIEEIKCGLIVVNANGVILTLNHQANTIFNLNQQIMPPRLLMNLSSSLARHFNRWLYAQFSDTRTIDLDNNAYSVAFARLHQHQDINLTLITLESVEESMQRIREARLVSLGRLSAGIAHEIRNPLASIQSAADLLQEMTSESESLYLIDKITHNSKRINMIISDVLNMFNDNSRDRELIHLNKVLNNIVAQLREDMLTKDACIELQLQETESFYVYFDEGHLAQIINNLVMNSLTHGGRDNIKVTITGQISKIGRQLYLDINDNGQGVDAGDEEKLFEPFFSKRSGTGLGLYLIREMCLANQAQIVFLPQSQGARFRMTMERYLRNE